MTGLYEDSRGWFPVRLGVFACLLALGCDREGHTRDDSSPQDAGAQAGGATIRQLTDADLVFSHEGQGARAGDFSLENAEVAFVIAGDAPHDSYVGFGGWVVDAKLKGRDDLPSYDGVGELIPQVNGCALEPRTITVLSDGSDGGPARLRIRGVEAPIPHVLNLVATEPAPQGLELELVYSLAPGSRALEITTTVTNPAEVDVPAAVGDFALLDSDEAAAVSVPHGYWLGSSDTQVTSLGIAHETMPWVLLVHGGDLPLMMPADAGIVRVIGDEAGLWQYTLPSAQVTAGQTLSRTRYVVLGRDVASARAHQLEITNVATGLVQGRVEAGGSQVEDALVSFFAADASAAFLGQAVTGADGRFEAQLAGGSYEVVAGGRGHGEHVETPGRPRLLAEGMSAGGLQLANVTAGETTHVDLSLSAPGRLLIRVRDEAGQPCAAKISFVAEQASAAPLLTVGEREPYAAEHIQSVYWTLDGDVEAQLPPGRYTAFASRGPGYSLGQQTVELESGLEAELSFGLARRIDVPGWVAMDSHLHAMDSQHGNASRAERAITAMSEGLDVMVNTDHDFIADYRSVVEQLGAQRALTPIPGVELTWFSNHHHNIWPLAPRPLEQRAGAFRWWQGGTLEDAFDHYAALGGIVFQINHGLKTFQDAGFDPATGLVQPGSDFSWRSNAMELQNGKSPRSRAGLLPIWYALLNHGRHIAPLGASDAHGRIPEPGSARTYVRVGDDAVTPENVARAVVLGRTVASTGPLPVLTALAPSAEVGDTVALAAGSSITLRIEVWGGEWLGIERVRLIENGTVLAEWDATTTPPVAVPGGDEPGLWFRHELPVTSSTDAWYAVEVVGSSSLTPAYPGAEAWAHSAPLWVDVL